jgi:hypothetical protein
MGRVSGPVLNVVVIQWPQGTGAKRPDHRAGPYLSLLPFHQGRQDVPGSDRVGSIATPRGLRRYRRDLVQRRAMTFFERQPEMPQPIRFGVIHRRAPRRSFRPLRLSAAFRLAMAFAARRLPQSSPRAKCPTRRDGSKAWLGIFSYDFSATIKIKIGALRT